MVVNPEQLLDCARRHGAIAAEVHSIQSQTQTVTFEANAPKQIETTTTQGIAIRLWRSETESGVAVAYGAIAPDLLVATALRLLTPGDPPLLNSQPPPTWHFPEPIVGMADLVTWGKDAIAAIRGDFPDVLCEGSWELATSESRLVNSDGLDYSRRDTSIGGGLQATWVRGDDLLAIGADRDWSPRGEAFQASALIEPVVADLLQRLRWASCAASAPTGSVPVILLPKVAELIWDSVAVALNGRQVLLGASPWQLEQRVIATDISLSQDPTQGYDGVPADDEGTPTQAATLIDNGTVRHFYGDRQVVKHLGQPALGNGFRGRLGSPATPGLFNLIAPKPSVDFASLLRDLGTGILVDQVLGDADPLSGDFAVNVDLGYRVEGGEIIGRIKDTLITGNAYAVLQDDLQLGAASPECDRAWEGIYLTPALRIPALSVASDT